MVVLGAEKETLTDLVRKLSVQHCYNDNYKEGMLSSVKCGFRNLPSDFEAVLVFQGDQPLITPKVINTVIEAYRSSGKGIVIPVYKKKRGHPLLIDRKYRNEIEKLDNHVKDCAHWHISFLMMFWKLKQTIRASSGILILMKNIKMKLNQIQ